MDLTEDLSPNQSSRDQGPAPMITSSCPVSGNMANRHHNKEFLDKDKQSWKGRKRKSYISRHVVGSEVGGLLTGLVRGQWRFLLDTGIGCLTRSRDQEALGDPELTAPLT